MTPQVVAVDDSFDDWESQGGRPYVPSADPAVWLAELEQVDEARAEARRRQLAAEVRAAFLRRDIAACGLPFSDTVAP